MEYSSIFDIGSVRWSHIGLSILQTFVIFWLVLIGLKFVGRRVFGEMGPQDLITLLLISEATDLGLTHEEAGFWGTLASILTILIMAGLIERVSFLRNLLEEHCIELVKNGRIQPEVLTRNLVQEEELQAVARQYGFADISVFDAMVLESDGRITGVLKSQYRPPAQTETNTPPNV